MRLSPLVAPFVIAAALGGATYATSHAEARSGAGLAAVAGYQVSDVHFHTDDHDPRFVDGVSFSLDSTPGRRAEATVQLSAGGPWQRCRLDGRAAVCAIAKTTFDSVDQIGVSVDG